MSAGMRSYLAAAVEHTTRFESWHPSGARLADCAGVVLDNGAPYGDAVLPLQRGGAGNCCAVSSVTAALLAQLLTAEVVRRFEAAGEVTPDLPVRQRPRRGRAQQPPRVAVRRTRPAGRLTGSRGV